MSVNADQLKRAKDKWKKFDLAAQTEFSRLEAIDKRKKLTVSSNPAEHATFIHLSSLHDGEYVSNCN